MAAEGQVSMPAYLPGNDELVRITAVYPNSGRIAVGTVVRVSHYPYKPYRCSGESAQLWPAKEEDGEWVLLFWTEKYPGNSVCQVQPITPDEEAVWRLSAEPGKEG